MAKFEYRSGGRRVSKTRFWGNIRQKMIDQAFEKMEERAQGAAASIVDPETGKQSVVFVRRKGNEGHVLSTQGSPSFARELERRLGVNKGTIETVNGLGGEETPCVYLAHASEDHETIARPLAEQMMARGIEVWLDGWEIRPGDSLRRKMESGLADSTHFVALLTPNALGKPWVETEIDAGFVRAVGGKARFIGLRIGVTVDQLSPFLKTMLCPRIDPADPNDIERLVADIHGVSRKPPRGDKPRYVQAVTGGVGAWSAAAAAVAEFLVRRSRDGRPMDPQARVAEIAAATELPEEDVRLGVLDLTEAGLIERSKEISRDPAFWPLKGLFVEFDRHFMGFDTEGDALALARRAISEGEECIVVADTLPLWFPDWSVRRLNSALAYLEDGRLIEAFRAIGGGPWLMVEMTITDRTRRFVRNHG
jgi:hypothetical protein